MWQFPHLPVNNKNENGNVSNPPFQNMWNDIRRHQQQLPQPTVVETAKREAPKSVIGAKPTRKNIGNVNSFWRQGVDVENISVCRV